MSGILGSESGPVAETTTSALKEPWPVSISQRSASESQVIFRTSWPRRRWGRMPKVSVTCSRYARMWRCPEKVRGQSGLGAKEKE